MLELLVGGGEVGLGGREKEVVVGLGLFLLIVLIGLWVIGLLLIVLIVLVVLMLMGLIVIIPIPILIIIIILSLIIIVLILPITLILLLTTIITPHQIPLLLHPLQIHLPRPTINWIPFSLLLLTQITILVVRQCVSACVVRRRVVYRS